MPRPIRATISAGALAHNLTVARRHAGAAKIWAVIKANAYGHGIERAARALAAADGFAVLDLQEALRLRAAGVAKPILLLEGFFEPADLELVSKHALTPVLHNPEQLEMLKHATLAGDIDAYLKVNSGMNRLGFGVDTLRAAYNALRMHPRVKSLTLMTHFADADGSGVESAARLVQRARAAVRGAEPLPRELGGAAALPAGPRRLGAARHHALWLLTVWAMAPAALRSSASSPR